MSDTARQRFAIGGSVLSSQIEITLRLELPEPAASGVSVQNVAGMKACHVSSGRMRGKS